MGLPLQKRKVGLKSTTFAMNAYICLNVDGYAGARMIDDDQGNPLSCS